MHERHTFFYEKAEADGMHEAKLMRLLDWDVSTGCANHDAQNALMWSVRPDVTHWG